MEGVAAVHSASESETSKRLMELARSASVGIANAKAQADSHAVTVMLSGYAADCDALGVSRCDAWANLAAASMWWMAELTRVLASERGRDISEEFEAMGRLAAGVMP